MKNHTKIYFNALGYSEGDFIPSEISHNKAVDIHHIYDREDRIENIMALTRLEHEKYGDKKKYMVFLYRIHRNFLEANRVEFDTEYIEQQIAKYREYETEPNYMRPEDLTF